MYTTVIPDRARVLFRLLYRLTIIAIVGFALADTAQAQGLSFGFPDPVGDQTGRVDIRNMLFNFDNTTGQYTILLTATTGHPFAGTFRININLLNPDAPLGAGFFSDTVNDFNLIVPTTSLILTGTNIVLRSWISGDRVATNHIPFGNPPGTGITAFRSAVVDIPFLQCAFCQEDNIVFGPLGFTHISGTGSSQRLPVLPVIVQPRIFIFRFVTRQLWVDPPSAYGFRYEMTSSSLFTKILDFPTGFATGFRVSTGGVVLGTFGPGETVTFPNGGVTEFTITGINPLADTDDPTAFPLQLDFNTPTASFNMEALETLTVNLDIKPGSADNSINPRSNGVIPVAILSTETFDASTVDATTVRFGANQASPVHSALGDVNGDGRADMILHFKTQDLGIVCGDISASLTGETHIGEVFQGSDSIKTVGCK